MKVLFLTNILSSYRADFIKEIDKECELTVLFERKNASHWLSTIDKTSKV